MNLYSFPFGDAPGRRPDELDTGPCAAWAPFALRAPQDRFLPFCLVRPANLSWIDCVRLVDADTLQFVGPSIPFPSSLYEKFSDGAYDYLLYYASIIPGLSIPSGRLRLSIDGYLSAPFTGCSNPEKDAVELRWKHSGPMGGVPYGTGLEQRYYAPRARIAQLESVENKRVSKGALDNEELDFLTLTGQSTFTAALVPAWLSQALTSVKAHDTATVNGLPALRLTTKLVDDDSCRASVSFTWEEPDPLIRRSCAPIAGPAVVPEPVGGYVPRGWRCGDTSDVAPDWQRKLPLEPECEQDAGANWVRKEPLESECETA